MLGGRSETSGENARVLSHVDYEAELLRREKAQRKAEATQGRTASEDLGKNL